MTQLAQRACGPASQHVGHGQALLSLGGSVPNYSVFGLGIVFLYVSNVEPVIEEHCTWENGNVVDGWVSLLHSVTPAEFQAAVGARRGWGRRAEKEEGRGGGAGGGSSSASALVEASHTLVHGEKKECQCNKNC